MKRRSADIYKASSVGSSSCTSGNMAIRPFSINPARNLRQGGRYCPDGPRATAAAPRGRDVRCPRQMVVSPWSRTITLTQSGGLKDGPPPDRRACMQNRHCSPHVT